MGERVTVGNIVYNVISSEWADSIVAGDGIKSPKNRFLGLRINITNSGGKAAPLPLLNVVNEKNEEFIEFSDMRSAQDWLGLLRQIPPALTETGIIYFDVPIGEYKLKVTDGAEPEHERTALIRIPFEIQHEAGTALPPGAQQK